MGDREQVAQWTRTINGALGQLRRPFGHRVSLAIEQYVSNYPARGSERLRDAFSDQLEQRIMPKLRGVDCHDGQVAVALDTLRGVVKELSDEPLLEAFNRAAAEDLFLWQGVEREA